MASSLREGAKVVFEAYPTIERFLRSNAFLRCIIGPVGSGKSSACVVDLMARAAAQKPGKDGIRRTRFAVIRNTYRELEDTTRKTFEQWVPAAAGTWREKDFAFDVDFPLSDGTRVKSEILFRSLNRPEDAKKLLSLEITGAYINEAREVPEHIFHVLQTRVGRYPAKFEGGPSWFGIWMDTNPWHTGHWGYKLFSKKRPHDYDLFEQPGGRTPEAENIHNLPPGYYTRLVAGKDQEWVESYIDGKYPSNDAGSIWGRGLAALEARGAITAFEHPNDGVFTSWDLGISDSTAIWWWRFNSARMPDVIDHYEASGQPMSHFFDELEKRPYRYVKHWLPHDARARTLQTGESILDQFMERYPNGVAIGPDLSLLDGIQAARWVLEQPMRIHTRCESGLEALREYRYEYDEDTKSYSRRPLHNFASHSADAFRYLACVVKTSDVLTRAADAPKPPPVRSMASFVLDELWDTAQAAKPEGRL